MQILFDVLRYKNFLSTGNLFTELNLNDAPTTLVVGENGAGKSTFIDAICYVLYNKSYRNINKPTLINSITQKNMMVEVEFKVGTHNYLVRRGMKPHIFEIFRDEVLVNQTTGILEYQEVLEKQILKMNFKSFTQIVILGAANYTPFMKLPAHARREVIEDLLDIQIFSRMNTLLKEKITQNKADVQDIEYKIELSKSKIELTEDYVNNLKLNLTDLIVDRKRKLAEYECHIGKYHSETEELLQAHGLCTTRLKKKTAVLTKVNEILHIGVELRAKKKKLVAEMSFFQEHSDCPTCEQEISPAFRQGIVETKGKIIEKIEAGLEDLEQEEKKREKLEKEVGKLEQEALSLGRQMTECSVKAKTYGKYVAELQKEIAEFELKLNNLKADDVASIQLQEEMTKFEAAKAKLLEDKDLYQKATLLLKDGGIKGKIVQQYIPLINQLINKYMTTLDFFAEFTLNEQFEEVIKSRFRDEFSYESFSEGEKRRIDLSILFAWRELGKLRNSSTSNLVVFDEILDGSLDTVGIDCFQDLMKLEKGSNVFVITHSGKHTDKFDNVVQFHKQKNFSTVQKRLDYEQPNLQPN